MQIPPERAYWILDFYRRQGTRLHIAEGISHIESSTYITIANVSPTLQWLHVRLFDDVTGESRERDISFGPARYFFSQMGDPLFMNDCIGRCTCHTALRVEFQDGVILCFTERIAEPPAHYSFLHSHSQSTCEQ
jgi:hypothetical protein